MAEQKLVWRDETSYSQSERGKNPEPRAWECSLEGYKVKIYRHIHVPGKWFVSCYRMDIDMHELKSADRDEAMTEALQHVKNTMEATVAGIQKALDVIAQSECNITDKPRTM